MGRILQRMRMLLMFVTAVRCATATSTAFRTVADVRSDPWTLHDPGFPVRVSVAPYADDQWSSADAERDASASGILNIPSSVLNISVVLPLVANVTSTQISVTLFRDRGEGETGAAFAVLANTQVQYSAWYRLDVGVAVQQMVLRVYVESHASGGNTLRAFYIRPVDFAPSKPVFLECPGEISDDGAEMRISSYPPTNMPTDLCTQYTMQGRVPIRKWYFDDQSNTESSYQERSFEEIEDLIRRARGRERNYYGLTDDYLFAALSEHPIKDKHVLIIGSTFPWYESICIAMEASSCTTIDYNKLRYHHPKIDTYTLTEFELSDGRKTFDAIFSISSFEHDGLGRYGDPLDPNADVNAMAGLLQYVKDTATGSTDATKLCLAVPVGADTIVWNAQRIYGPLRLPLLMQDWTLLNSYGFDKTDFTAPFTVGHQPLFVLQRKPETASPEEHVEL